MRTLLGMQYGGAIQQQYPRQQLQLQPQPQSFQEGGGVSAGLAGLKRLMKKRKASDVYGEEQAEQVEKQKKAGLFGSLLSFAGCAGMAWATPLIKAGLLTNPATAAWAIPLLIGGASAFGKYGGEKIGYGGEQDIDMDMMYAKEAGLGDIERAGEEYQSDMLGRAAVSGLKSGLTAGFAPDGGMYGKIAGRGAPVTAAGTAAGTALPELGVAGGFQPDSFLSGDLGSRLAGAESGLNVIPETLGNIPSGGAESLLGGAGDALSAYTGTAAQNRALLEAGNYEGASIVDALKKAGLDSSKLGRQNMWQNLFAPQIAGLMGGGMIKQNPQSLLGYLAS